MGLPKKLTAAQFSLIMISLIFATFVVMVVAMFTCDAGRVGDFGGAGITVILFEMVILGIGAAELESF